jgi:hypothetical protein
MHKWCVCWNYTDMEINGFGTSVMCSHSKASCNCAHFQGEMTTFSSRGSSAVAEPEVSPWTTYFQSLHNILTLECGNWRRCLFYAPKSLNRNYSLFFCLPWESRPLHPFLASSTELEPRWVSCCLKSLLSQSLSKFPAGCLFCIKLSPELDLVHQNWTS